MKITAIETMHSKPVLVSKDAFASWTKVTVNFTVSGL